MVKRSGKMQPKRRREAARSVKHPMTEIAEKKMKRRKNIKSKGGPEHLHDFRK